MTERPVAQRPATRCGPQVNAFGRPRYDPVSDPRRMGRGATKHQGPDARPRCTGKASDVEDLVAAVNDDVEPTHRQRRQAIANRLAGENLSLDARPIFAQLADHDR